METELKNKTIINKKGIKAFLETAYYPLYFLDFETFNPAIPPFSGTRPYQKIPFQFSLHCLDNKKAKLKHYEFLSEEGTDPREEIAKRLTKLIPGKACVIAYNISFEKDVKKIRKNLLEYCKLDTYAIVKLLEKLKEV